MSYNLNFSEKNMINEHTPTLIKCLWKNLVISLEIKISFFLFFFSFILSMMSNIQLITKKGKKIHKPCFHSVLEAPHLTYTIEKSLFSLS